MGLVSFFSLWATGLAWLMTRGQGSHLQLVGDVQAAGWVLCKFAHLWLGPTYRAALPLYEFASLLFLMGLAISDGARVAWWKPWLFALVLGQAGMWIVYPRDAPLVERWPYLVALNVLGILQSGVLVTASLRRRFMA